MRGLPSFGMTRMSLSLIRATGLTRSAPAPLVPFRRQPVRKRRLVLRLDRILLGLGRFGSGGPDRLRLAGGLLVGRFLGQAQGAQLGGPGANGRARSLVLRHRLGARLLGLQLLVELGLGPLAVSLRLGQGWSPFAGRNGRPSYGCNAGLRQPITVAAI